MPCKGCCLRRVAPNTNEQRSRSGLCERVIRREATETKGLVLYIYCDIYHIDSFLEIQMISNKYYMLTVVYLGHS